MSDPFAPPPARPLPDASLRRAWQDAMARWQVGPAVPGQPPSGRPARPDDAEEVTVSDLDPLLCAVRGWP